MTLALLLLAACGGDVVLTPKTEGCVDYDFANPADSTIEWEADASGAARVWRTNALMEQTGMSFDPELVPHGNVLEVYESWAGGEADEAFCYQPVVQVEGLVAKLKVEWYLEPGDTVPYDTVEIEP